MLIIIRYAFEIYNSFNAINLNVHEIFQWEQIFSVIALIAEFCCVFTVFPTI